jgi:hypothetical protein
VCALSSVARLSISMTMSMSSGLFSLGDDADADKPPAILDDKGKHTDNRHSKRDSANAGISASAGNSHTDDGIYLDLYGNKKAGGKSKSSPLLSLKHRDWQRDETSFNDEDKPSSSSARFGSPVKLFNRSPGKSSSYKSSPSRPKRSPARSKSCRQSHQQPSPPQDRPTFHLSPPTSPINSSGVEIVIEPGTDSSNSMSPPTTSAAAVVVDPDTQNANCDYLTVDHAYSNDSSQCDNNASTNATASQVHLLSEMDH